MHPFVKLLVSTFIIMLLYFVIDAKFIHMTSRWTLDEQK